MADDETAQIRFSPTEEANLLVESDTLKAAGNRLFTEGQYGDALQQYHRALGSCPVYLDYDVAVLQSNVAICHLKLLEWQDAIDWATRSLESLERVIPEIQTAEPDIISGPTPEKSENKTSLINHLEALAERGISRQQVEKIKTKALLRRAKGREGLGTWASLQGAEEDYKRLLGLELASLDRDNAQKALATLPAKLDAAKQKEVGEMMGKLKQLGNGILRPFGLSTENFNMVKDENSGGYSLQFNQGK